MKEYKKIATANMSKVFLSYRERLKKQDDNKTRSSLTDATDSAILHNDIKESLRESLSMYFEQYIGQVMSTEIKEDMKLFVKMLLDFIQMKNLEHKINASIKKGIKDGDLLSPLTDNIWC